ncbi:MAG: hypothetical protein BGO78_03675 [Chloroflexi bacterium 44-23]|nr:MAG: hypothetical protein BGO78_03675 [Chloroflexi bacterium 44-23]
MKTKFKQKGTAKKKSQRNWQILVGIGIFLIIMAGLSLTHKAESESIQRAVKGQPLGDFSLLDLHANEIHLSDYRGKIVLINSWASWCPPCMAEMPALEKFYQQNKGHNFEILAVNAGESQATAQNFVRRSGVSFPILLDEDASTLTAMGINGYPTSILVGPDGNVLHIHIGLFFPEDLEKEISPFLVSQ